MIDSLDGARLGDEFMISMMMTNTGGFDGAATIIWSPRCKETYPCLETFEN